MFITPLLALSVAAPYCPPLGLNQVRQCYRDYFNSYNLTLFPDFWQFEHVINNKIKNQGLSGLEKECQIQNRLIQCLGKYETACVTGAIFEAQFGLSFQDAYAYAGEYAEAKYYCNDGYSLTKEYYDCLVETESSPEINNCVTMTLSDIHAGKVCKAYTDMVYCSGQVYTTKCGAGIAPLVCNMAQLDLQTQVGEDKCQWFDCSHPFPYNGTSTM